MQAAQYYFTSKVSDGVLIVTEEPIVCAGCDTPHYAFVNRFGETRCLQCRGEVAAIIETYREAIDPIESLRSARTVEVSIGHD